MNRLHRVPCPGVGTGCDGIGYAGPYGYGLSSGYGLSALQVDGFFDTGEAVLVVGWTNPGVFLAGLADEATEGIDFAKTVRKFFDRISVLFVVDWCDHRGCDRDDVPEIPGAAVFAASSGSGALQDPLAGMLTAVPGDHGKTGSPSKGNTKVSMR